MPPAFLAVASQPSSQLSLNEFHDWYEEEHIPLRLNRLPSFLSGARYYAADHDVSPPADETRPGWLAMYEIDDTQTFSDESYTNLRLQRSEREKGVMNRLSVLTRKTGELLGVWGEDEGTQGIQTTGLKVGKPSEWIITHGISATVSGDEGVIDLDDKLKKWAVIVTQILKEDSNGWIRTRLVKVLEKGVTKMGINAELEKEEESINYFAVHEFLDQGAAMSEATKAVIRRTCNQHLELADWRIWKLLRAYPCIAQHNLH
ncbi:hypothetical protein JR316_0009611 [Psilocybe cubensis]|uniref:EthD domain-containing protein n=2 Tax=Psilocybe cubensis TaxID=181762 RepID=A0A8H7XQ74_PSICU|nr:hypothetical protein JR316_0009611 [Psilocybe cubensis]KAH9477398.1 hypothetical protein JR316_0009611 [Psilocybe cubensis]